MSKFSRRTVLAGMGAAAAATALPTLPAIAQDRSIRHFWWGNPERDKRTFAVIDVFQKHHPEIAVSGETVGWGDYWTKMATQTAGRNMADLVQMDYSLLFEYARRGALKTLDEHIGNGLDLSNFDKGPLSGGYVDGKLYALNIGSNSQVMPLNARLLEEAGITADPILWTWDEYADVCEAITSKTDVKGSDDLSLVTECQEVWARQNGHGFYNEDGTLGLTFEDVSSYWNYWAELRAADLVRSKDKTVILDAPFAEGGMIMGETAMSMFWSNQIVGLQALMKDPVAAGMVPHKADGEPGQFIKPSMFMSLTRDAKDVEAAIMYMSDWVNDPEATAILGLERGIPANPNVRAALAPNFTPPEKVSVAYFGAIQDKVGALPLPSPKGHNEVRDAYMRIGTDVVLGSRDVAGAAEEFVQTAGDILERAK